MENQFKIKEIHEKRFNQKAKCIWFTGLSGSGKTTLALALQSRLIEKGFVTQYLDGDLLRTTINCNLGFSDADRLENIRRTAEITRLFIDAGFITINAFISPTEEIRNLAKSIIGPENFLEIYLSTSLQTCEKRDPKGLYLKARQGLIPNFTGLDAVYDIPQAPTYTLDTENKTIEEAVELLWSFIKNDILFS